MKRPRKSEPMRIVALAASKGGVGKSTLTAALAVRAAEDFARVALVDCDPQESISSWWDRRGAPNNPRLFEDVDSSTEAIGLIAAEGWQWLFLDTPPSQLDRIETVIACSDLVLIPTRPGIMDIEAARVTEELCQENQRPYAFVLNMVTPGAAATSIAAAHLRTNRRTLLDPFISYRQSHSSAMSEGRTASESRDTTARRELDDLWRSVQSLVSTKSKVPT